MLFRKVLLHLLVRIEVGLAVDARPVVAGLDGLTFCFHFSPSTCRLCGGKLRRVGGRWRGLPSSLHQ